MYQRLKTPLKGVALLALAALCMYIILPVQQKIKLGLDLQGGVRVLLELQPTKEVPTITRPIQNQAIEVVQRRVNTLGVSEPVITSVGNNRILVELPNVKDPDEAVRLLKDVAKLDFKIVPDAVAVRADRDKKYGDNGAYADSGPIVYSGADLKGAQAAYDQSGQPMITFQTKDPGKFGKLTQESLGKRLGIFLDKAYVSAPVIQGVITADGQITGNFTEQDTVRIANELNAGALPVPITIVENDTVGATLGKTDLTKSLWASVFGLGLVLVFMAVVYRLPGVLADIALVLYVLMLLALLAAAHAVLTLPGIAGFVLSIGMAVDANVLIFERMKEELWAGKTLRAAVRVGFQRAFTAVFDSHFTTIVGAGVLFWLGTGTVKGFAYTLFWGTAFSLFTATFVTRFFVDLFVDSNIVTDQKAYGA
jgi:preprotein translocase subunit SecD